MKSKYLKNRYEGDDLVRVYLLNRPRDETYKVRIKDGWAYLYNKNKLIWDCNEIFFNKHFYECIK